MAEAAVRLPPRNPSAGPGGARRESIYEPPGPPSEALASYYVRHIVQRAIDRAFMLKG